MSRVYVLLVGDVR